MTRQQGGSAGGQAAGGADSAALSRAAAAARQSGAMPRVVQAPPPDLRAVENRPVARAPQERAPEGRPSWMGEVLRRADEGEPSARVQAPRPAARPGAGSAGRQPLQGIDGLSSLSVDIARAIDHETQVEMWDRYQQGERGVFGRRLYTQQGQKTFEEIRNKYAGDREFRAAVDRYIADFEKLMEEVSRNDRDNMMTRTYLTSDTGKVYTMLAHAAGRLV
jgi:hypothetical protein